MKTQDFYGTSRSAWRRALALVAATGAIATLSACQTNSHASFDQKRPNATVLGRVKATGADGAPLMILAIDRTTGKVAHRAFLGSTYRAFAIPLQSGTYKFYACADQNQDGYCGSSEPMSAMYSLSERVNAGDTIQLPTIELGSADRVASTR